MASLNTKITGGVALAGLISALTAGTGIWVASSLGDGLEDSLGSAQVLRYHTDADMMRHALRADVVSAMQSSTIGIGFDSKVIAADFAAHTEAIAKDVARARELATDPATVEALEAVAAPLMAYKEAALAILKETEASTFGAQEMFPAFKEQYDALEIAMADATRRIEAAAAAEAEAAVENGSVAEALMGGLLAVALLVSAGIALVSRRQVVKPLQEVTDVLDRLSKGDLTAEPPHTERSDEIGRMNQALQAFHRAVVERQSELEAADQREALEEERARSEALRAESEQAQTQVVSSIAHGLSSLSQGDFTVRLEQPFPAAYEKLRGDFNLTVSSLAETIGTILTTVGAIRDSSGEISRAADDLSLRTQQQASGLEEAAAALGEITETVHKTSAGARTPTLPSPAPMARLNAAAMS